MAWHGKANSSACNSLCEYADEKNVRQKLLENCHLTKMPMLRLSEQMSYSRINVTVSSPQNKPVHDPKDLQKLIKLVQGKVGAQEIG